MCKHDHVLQYYIPGNGKLIYWRSFCYFISFKNIQYLNINTAVFSEILPIQRHCASKKIPLTISFIFIFSHALRIIQRKYCEISVLYSNWHPNCHLVHRVQLTGNKTRVRSSLFVRSVCKYCIAWIIMSFIKCVVPLKVCRNISCSGKWRNESFSNFRRWQQLYFQWVDPQGGDPNRWLRE